MIYSRYYSRHAGRGREYFPPPPAFRSGRYATLRIFQRWRRDGRQRMADGIPGNRYSRRPRPPW